jgi:hypothetical protein
MTQEIFSRNNFSSIRTRLPFCAFLCRTNEDFVFFFFSKKMKPNDFTFVYIYGVYSQTRKYTLLIIDIRKIWG